MMNIFRTSGLLFCCVLLLLLAVSAQAAGARVGSRLQAALAVATDYETIPVIVYLSEQLDPAAYRQLPKQQRRQQLVQELRAISGRSQQQLRNLLQQAGIGRIKDLWHINALAFAADPALIRAISSRPEVASVTLDGLVTLPTAQPAAVSTAEWNLAAIGVFDLWPRLLTSPGNGMVVANIDTGVDATHPNLQNWRAGPYDWLDLRLTTTSVPVDDNGHGTAVMGVIAGSNVGGSNIGIAPAAQWIATNPFAASTASFADLHAAFAWALDPDGDPNTDDAPDVVNNSWALLPENRCSNEFQPDIDLLKAAGIGVVFAAGNEGSAAASSTSPANNQGTVAVGATDAQSRVAWFSSRGPSACDSDTFPELVAPGVDIWSTIPGGYGSVAGTSFSAPHVTGVMALLMQAYPAATVTEIETAMTASAVDLGPVGPDPAYGFGQLQAMNAWRYLAGEPILAVHDPSAPENDLQLDFAAITPGTTMVRDLTLRNAGSSDLLISSIDFSGLTTEIYLEADQCSGVTLAAGATCRISLNFSPADFITYSASLVIPSSDPLDGSILVTLTGTGNTPPPAASLLTPGVGAANVGSPVAFSWVQAADADGDAVSTALLISQTPDFSQSSPIIVTSVMTSGSTVLLAGCGLFAFAVLLRRRCWRFLLVGLATWLLLSCGSSGGGGLTGDLISYEHSGLLSGTSYYWQVETTDARGAVVQSATRQFTTAL